MALTVSASLSVVDVEINLSQAISLTGLSQSGRGVYQNVQTISNVPNFTTINVGSIGVPGWALIRNLDAVNYCTFGTFVGGSLFPCFKIKAGHWAGPIYLSTKLLGALANTAPVQLLIIICEE